MGLYHSAVLALGSNLGDRAAYLLRAIAHLIAANVTIVACSEIYETDPVDYLAQPAFLNMVVLIKVPPQLSPQRLLSLCLNIETTLGRVRDIDKGPRTIDIDLLCYQDLVLNEAEPQCLILPHPRLHERRFVLVPLCQLIADEIHPVQQLSYRELLLQLPDLGDVRLYQSRGDTLHTTTTNL